MSELDIKLAKWRWPECEVTIERNYIIVSPFIPKSMPSYNIELFTISLDSCFKWLVSLLWVCEMSLEEGIFYRWKVGHPDYPNSPQSALDELPARALCKALDKLFYPL